MDAQHTGRSPYAGPTDPTVLRSFNTLEPDGAIDQPGDPRPDIESSAAIGADGTIYIGNFRGALEALRDPGSGRDLQLAWRFHVPGGSSFHATPALGPNGEVFIGMSTGGATPEAKGTFYALKAPASGTEPQVLWQVDLGPGRYTASPTLGPDGTLYVLSGTGTLFAMGQDGSVKWTAKTGPIVKAAPALGQDGTVYVSSMDDHLYAVAPPTGGGSDGTTKWSFKYGDHPGSGPLVTDPNAAFPGANGTGSGDTPSVGPDGTVYVGANNSNFYAIAPDGQLRWMYEAEREVAGIWSSGAISADGKTVYFGANKGGIYAVNTQDGSLRWQFDIVGSVYNSPTLDGQGRLYTGSTVGHLFAVDADKGTRIFDYATSGPIWTAPSIRADSTLVIGLLNGQVQVIGNR
jgi:outer membrane protein assembly factor BamB